MAIPDPRTSLWITDCAAETLAYDFFFLIDGRPTLSQIQASAYGAPPLGKWLGLNLVWGCMRHRYGMSYIQSSGGCGTNLLQILYPTPIFFGYIDFLWLHCATLSLRNMQIQCGLSGFVPHSLLSLGLPFFRTLRFGQSITECSLSAPATATDLCFWLKLPNWNPSLPTAPGKQYKAKLFSGTKGHCGRALELERRSLTSLFVHTAASMSLCGKSFLCVSFPAIQTK